MGERAEDAQVVIEEGRARDKRGENLREASGERTCYGSAGWGRALGERGEEVQAVSGKRTCNGCAWSGRTSGEQAEDGEIMQKG